MVDNETKSQRAIRKCLEKVNKRYNKALSKIAKTPINFKTHQDGILGRFETNDGASIVSYTSAQFLGTMGMLPFTTQQEYLPMIGFCGTIANKPVPASLFLKKVKTGLFKKQLFFLPVSLTPGFSAKETYENKSAWNPLLERLNRDENLLQLLGGLPTEKAVMVTQKTTRVFKINDEDRNFETVCQVIPFKDKTLIGTRNLCVEKEKDIFYAVMAIERIRRHVLEYDYDKPTTGQIPQAWAGAIYGLCNSNEPC